MNLDSPASRSLRRRPFFARCGLYAFAAALGEVARVSISGQEAGSGDADEMFPLDYGRSFLVGKNPANRVRFVVESRTRVIDTRKGRSEDFIQCCSCKAEDTFAEKDLFKPDNYDFLPVFGSEDGLIFRRKAYLNGNYRSTVKAAEMWGGQVYQLRDLKGAKRLDDWEAIRAASDAGSPVVAQTRLSNEETGLRAIIEHPVKTLNIHDEGRMYQTDTGPVAFPDLGNPVERLVDCLSLAYVAFNTDHFADFVIEDVTPINEGDREVTKVWHYERRVSLEARNSLWAAPV